MWLLFICFIVFSLHYHLSSLFFDDNKIDIVKYRLWTIANYVAVYDTTSARIIARLDNIILSLQWSKNTLDDQYTQIVSLREDINNNKESLNSISKNKYEKLIQFIIDLKAYRDEILSYLWKEQERHYLIILENTSESRPNWWFFGSFAIISLYEWRIKTFHLLDAYFPQKYNPTLSVRLPEWSRPIYPLGTSTRVAANKFWFHDLDGETLIALYDETFNKANNKKLPAALCQDICNKEISGVVFLKTSMITKILPEFTKKQWEWQFLNANIDILRGQNLPNKKEKYFANLKIFLSDHWGELIKQAFRQFDALSSQNYLGIYLPKGSSWLNTTLNDYQFITKSPQNQQDEEPMLYLWDTNISFNKINDFVVKTTTITNSQWDSIIESNNSMIPLSKLAKGDYTMKITYDVNVPDFYKNYIIWLEALYGITMTDRERGILALEATDNYPDLITRLFAVTSQIYYPANATLKVSRWDWFHIIPFTSPRGKGLEYKIQTDQNKVSPSISFDMTID